MGSRRLETLSDAAQQGYYVELVCGCGHRRRLDPHKLLTRLMRRGASTRLDRLNETIKCGKCGGKAFRAEYCDGPLRWSR